MCIRDRRRDIESPAEADRQVRHVTADPAAVLEDIDSRRQGIAGAVLKLDVGFDPVADRLDPSGPGLSLAKKLPGFVHEQVREAVATRQGVVEELARNLVDGELWGLGGIGIGLGRDRNDGVVADHDLTDRHDQPLDRVAVEIGVLIDGDLRLRGPGFSDQPVAGV